MINKVVASAEEAVKDVGDGAMLVAVTEKRTRDELDAFVEVISDAL